MAQTRRAGARRGAGHWLRAVARRQWSDFLSSYDPERVLASSSPGPIGWAVGTLIALTLVIAYVPYFQFANFRSPWPSVGFALTGGFITSVAWRNGCTGRLGSWATLFDNSFYCASLSWLAAIRLKRSACSFRLPRHHAAGFPGPLLWPLFAMATAVSVPPLAIGGLVAATSTRRVGTRRSCLLV